MAGKVEKCRKFALAMNSNSIRQGNLFIHQKLLHNGPDTVDELLDRHVVKKEKSYDNDEEELSRRQRLMTTRREALSLYRDILRATRFFIWPDSHGVLWRDVLRENARREFEESRFERDPEIITRLLIGGRDSVQAALDKLVEKQKQEMAKDQTDRER
ncbi:LYR family of Fe/S cluster biogenesis protein [Thalictrum thalictroides]|uniref:LYR family of Fe/S cluster biogenesis protein n=1 Tax=Thalictrum thalictroides TaxID=46969 RepID=A0A7J6V5R2_THATH|nr:LYR family of Fe/S cluster biogenesis protein [Thalictrum thalictroides]